MLLFTDLDRTLLAHDYTIHGRVKSAFAKARDSGLQIIFVTARAPASLLPIARELDNLGLCACYNGGWIGRLDSDDVYHQSRLSRELGRAIMAHAAELGAEPVWYGQSGILAHRLTDALVRQLANVSETASLFGQAPPDGPFKVLCMDRRDEPQLRRIAERWSNEASVAQSHKVLLEIGPKNTSKGTAVRYIAARLGVDPKDCHAAGDSYNDIPMLEAVGKAFTVANAVDEVKAFCKFEGASCDDGGLADVIDVILAGSRR